MFLDIYTIKISYINQVLRYREGGVGASLSSALVNEINLMVFQS